MTSSLSRAGRISVRAEHPWVVGEGQEQVSGLRPRDEPLWDWNSRPLGAKSHASCLPPAGDKCIAVRADFYSQDIERGGTRCGGRGAESPKRLIPKPRIERSGGFSCPRF